MRIISGTARGRKLKDFAGTDIRPTSDMVKESIFNIVQFDIEGRRVLDLFAGTGQIGIEALSRGARSAEFVDTSADAVKLIRANVELCGFKDNYAIYRRDALSFLSYCEKYDLIFLDPPFDTPLADEAIGKIIEFDKLNANGIIICETRVGLNPQVVSPPYYMQKEYKYGEIKVTRYERS